MKDLLKKYQDKWIVLRTKSGLDPAGVVEKVDDNMVTLRYERHGSDPVYWYLLMSEVEGVFINPKELDNQKRK
ncbi:MAG TPA: hypothetical protein VFC63_08165 [Blastocatellia bacterium]|nr:hypothetical protein [Blastocatellia bacterium]